MNKLKHILFAFICTSIGLTVNAQIVCDNVEFIPNTSVEKTFTFDTFSKYLSGITYNAVTTIRVNVDEQAPPNPNCKWLLRMEVRNNPVSGSAANEWETKANYSPTSTTPIPTINILGVRVDNGCNTPNNAGIYQNFTNHADQIEIIQNTGVLITAGSCVTNVNGPGDFYSNYDEYTFKIDMEVDPGFNFRPGVYELELVFHIEEVP